MPSIIHLRTDLWPGVIAGGSLAHAAGMIQGFASCGYEVRSIGPEPLPGLDERAWEGPRAESASPRWKRPFAPLRYTHSVVEHVRDRPDPAPELIYARYSLMSDAPVRLARLTGKPCVLEVNGLAEWFSNEFHGWRRLIVWPLIRKTEAAVLRGADLCVAISAAVSAQLEAAGVTESRILTQSNGVDPDRFPPGLSGESVRTARGLGDAPVVGFVGTFGDWHGAENLVKAMPLVLKTHPNARFLFVGDGARRAPAQELCRSLGAAHAAVFTGLVPQQEAPPYLAACDILVAPHSWNRKEPFIGSPTKLFEYMAAGKGIVASRLGQIAEVIEHEKTGLLVPPDDIDSLAAAIVRLLDSPEASGDMGARARTAVLERYTWRRNAGEILAWLAGRGTR
ncbi:MAG: glycosyltransferase family 4 protein [Vicinamibacteria bacterium]|nr:glycosyltransferase family 4 protein [Vicinamibacteria bacterium]